MGAGGPQSCRPRGPAARRRPARPAPPRCVRRVHRRRPARGHAPAPPGSPRPCGTGPRHHRTPLRGPAGGSGPGRERRRRGGRRGTGRCRVRPALPAVRPRAARHRPPLRRRPALDRHRPPAGGPGAGGRRRRRRPHPYLPPPPADRHAAGDPRPARRVGRPCSPPHRARRHQTPAAHQATARPGPGAGPPAHQSARGRRGRGVRRQRRDPPRGPARPLAHDARRTAGEVAGGPGRACCRGPPLARHGVAGRAAGRPGRAPAGRPCRDRRRRRRVRPSAHHPPGAAGDGPVPRPVPAPPLPRAGALPADQPDPRRAPAGARPAGGRFRARTHDGPARPRTGPRSGRGASSQPADRRRHAVRRRHGERGAGALRQR